METIILFAPLVGALIAGFGWKIIGETAAQYLTTGLLFLAAILFGFLYQGGAELALWTSIPRELIVVIQALVILFTGALDNMVRIPLEKMFLMIRSTRAPKPERKPVEPAE